MIINCTQVEWLQPIDDENQVSMKNIRQEQHILWVSYYIL